ncbi:hypothetical protein [Dactylosporangium sp. CA-139066]|uniref:hypothetical protein n=1 Tax=Dactylosporangium sp. CA-139066 TaxID=3239930 RepID=UPI003D933069
MKHITALLTLVVAAGALAGCEAEFTTDTGGQGRVIAASASPLPPAEALKAAVKNLDETAYTFGIKQGDMTGGGRIDSRAKVATMQIGGDVGTTHISVAYTIVTPELWIKADFGDDLNKQWGLDPVHWLLVDRSKVSSTATLPVDSSGAPELGVTELFKDGLGEVTRTDATHFAGTVDMTVANSVLAPSADTLKSAGAKAKAVPFTATTDDKGRLTSFVIDGASISSDLAMSLTFAGFGEIQPVTKPTGAIPAPDSVYQLFD